MGKSKEWLEHDGLLKIEGWARDGLTDKQISEKMGIAYSTFRVWRDKFPAFSAALKRGKAPVDFKVENKLLKRALGYEYEEIVTVIRVDESGNETKEVKRFKKYALPDTTAILFWLKNRRPEKWRKMSPVFEEKVNAEIEKLRAEINQIEQRMVGVDLSENVMLEYFEKLERTVADDSSRPLHEETD